MLVTEIYDGQGLGNQLWCYVTTRAIALDRGYDFGIMSPEKFKCLDFMELDFGRPVVGGSGPEGGPPRRLPDGIEHYYQEKRTNLPGTTVDIRRYDPDLVSVPDNTKIDGVMQDERYIRHRRAEIQQWLKVKPEFECLDYADDDVCVINFRGGEYVGVRSLFLTQKYWDDAVRHMRALNPAMRFVVITDDTKTARRFFPRFEVRHFSIAKDYAVIKNARHLILSNSSFACLPAWLNDDLRLCIAPKYWARHNVSDGYWACGYNLMQGWQYLDREGNLNDYETCRRELDEWEAAHAGYYEHPKVTNNFLVVSNFYNDLGWVPEYADDYLVLDQSDNPVYPPKLDRSKAQKTPHLGHNIRDYCTYILEHYDELPERVAFVTGNVFPRHIAQDRFDELVNRPYLTPFEDRRRYKVRWPVSLFSSDGGFMEINNSWYLNHHPTRYFHDYNDFLRFAFKDPVIPRYVRFAPAAGFVVPREVIRKYPPVFYENLRTFVSHTDQAIPGESHLLERAFHTIWYGNFELSDQMLQPVDPAAFKAVPRRLGPLTRIRRGVRRFAERRQPEPTIASQAGRVKIYDVFTFFNELDLLEMRLAMLAPYVDKFVIIEATETFTGKPKPLYFEENKKRFAAYADKIIHYVVRDTPKSREDLEERLTRSDLTPLEREIVSQALTSDNVPKDQLHWLKEFYQKESIRKALVGLDDDAACFVGDLDEIWNPQARLDLRRDGIFKLRQTVYAYFLNNRSSEPWAGTLVTQYRNIRRACLNHLRTASKTRYAYVPNGGWHFTNQGGAERVRTKIESWGHQEYNTEDIKKAIEERIAKNEDFVGRRFRFTTDERGLPPYLLENREKYKAYFK